MQDALDIQTLGELDEWAFDQYSYLIKDENRLKREKHSSNDQIFPNLLLGGLLEL